MLHLRAVTSAALSTAALCLAGVLGPPGAMVALFLILLPQFVLGGHIGTREVAASSVMAAFVVGVTIGWPAGLAYLLVAGIPALLTVYALRAAWRLEAVLALGLGACLLACVSLVWISAGDFASLQSSLRSSWDESFQGLLALYRELGLSADRLSELSERRDELADAVLDILPALLCITGGAVWLFNLRLSSRWTGWPQLHDLARWQCPFWAIWILIVSGFAMFAPVHEVGVAARNLFTIMLACYFCQGLAIVSFFFQRFRLPRGLRVATYVLIGFQQLVAAIVLALGVFDFWGDFRQLGPRAADASVGSDSD
jgi:hypothetical protein